MHVYGKHFKTSHSFPLPHSPSPPPGPNTRHTHHGHLLHLLVMLLLRCTTTHSAGGEFTRFKSFTPAPQGTPFKYQFTPGQVRDGSGLD